MFQSTREVTFSSQIRAAPSERKEEKHKMKSDVFVRSGIFIVEVVLVEITDVSMLGLLYHSKKLLVLGKRHCAIVRLSSIVTMGGLSGFSRLDDSRRQNGPGGSGLKYGH
ncbi:hypothetical protein Tco_1525513 [Tanacetum coccineum]